MLNFKYQIIDAAEWAVKNLKKEYSGFGNKYKGKRAMSILTNPNPFFEVHSHPK
jgi:hypothetical protein